MWKDARRFENRPVDTDSLHRGSLVGLHPTSCSGNGTKVPSARTSRSSQLSKFPTPAQAGHCILNLRLITEDVGGPAHLYSPSFMGSGARSKVGFPIVTKKRCAESSGFINIIDPALYAGDNAYQSE